MMVGDSTMASLFKNMALVSSAGAGLLASLPQQALPLPCGANLTFMRSDWLADRKAYSCDLFECDWRAALTERLTLVLSTGLHQVGDVLHPFDRVHPPNTSRAARVTELHVRMEHAADELAAFLARSAVTRVLWLRAAWGVPKPLRHVEPPLATPLPPSQMYGWDQTAAVNEIYVKALRAALRPGVLRVVDPTRSLAMQPSCRRDHVHFVNGVGLVAVWPRILAALRDWNPIVH